MKIVLGAELFIPGTSGMATAVRNLAEDLAGAGHVVTVVCPASKVADEWGRRKDIKIVGCTSVQLPMGIQQRVAIVTDVNDLRGLLRSADVVHLHSPLLLGRTIVRIARELAIPLVVTNHAMPENVTSALRLVPLPENHFLSRAIWRQIGAHLGAADLVTAPTRFAADAIYRRFQVVADVISNGVRIVPTAHITIPSIGSTMNAVYVGRLQREKHVDDLLLALRACIQANLSVGLTIAGDGPDRRRLERLTASLGVGGHVQFLGIVSDQRRDDLYDYSHCLWTASRAELQSCVALEAMARGRPVVAARAGALPETIPDGVAGRLFDPEHPEEIAFIMRQFRWDWRQYRDLCVGAAETAAEHASHGVRRAYEAIYTKLAVRKTA